MQRVLALGVLALRVGRGRPVALALLALAALLIVFPEHSPLRAARLALFDTYQAVYPRERLSGPVTLVGIDEASLREIGQWPWPRTRLAGLIDAIAVHRAAAIGLDILMPEADQTSPEALAARLPDGHEALRAELGRLPPNDAQLARSIAAAPVVLGAAGFDHATPASTTTLRAWPLRTSGDDPLPHVRRYTHVLTSLAAFQAAASGQALLSTDLERGVVRRVPLVHAVGETLVPGLALELLRVGLAAGPLTIETGPRGVAAITVGDLRIPTQPDGEAWVHYTRFLPGRYVSARDVLASKVGAEHFENKLVIVALTGLGLMDYKTTAHGEQVPGVEMHAQLAESFFDGRFLTRPHWLPWTELSLLLAGGCFLIWAMPSLRPRISTLLAVMLAVVLFGGGCLLFRFAGLLFDATSVFTGLNVVFVSLLSSVFIETDRARQVAQLALQHERESAAKVAGELEAARRIQLGTLPDAATAFPGETRFEVAASLEPARAVGGDLYDFFMLDASRLFVLIGDVSGKGIPASLFMSISKALAKSIALRAGADTAGIIDRANAEISRDNPESLFVTLFAAILDVDTGEIEYWSAGHDAPYRISGSPGRLESPGGGPPLCMLEDFPYRPDRARLAPGDMLVLYTDGITEAFDRNGVAYGSPRLAATIASLPPGTSAAQCLDTLRADVRTFVDGAEASDDLTLVVVRWLGNAADDTQAMRDG